MFHNFFEDNQGESAYGILLKEISDGYLLGNQFIKNTAAIYLEGAGRMHIENNVFSDNGWAMRIQASCMEDTIFHNNFTGNTFDISTNGSLVLNVFDQNFWDKYEGYDLDRNGIGDIPFHPLSMYAMMVEKNPPAILLHHSFMVQLLDRSEKLLPSITPEDFIDLHPLMHPLKL
jgi:nitrous oxidase accessory protein